ncbi:hypothetical protein BGZ80_006934 [Entomortierella chlamydospora]|uniref:Uncharacterized protein n=1 Tax=Entomortierella chlamydospora TaxID=101097 RepID=A0A9P6MGD0_9FUNG|nr:hypothetical protein BGZ80_006934 [Entomortierella chlamydospora]
MWLRDSGGKFRSLFASGQEVNGLANFSGWHTTAIAFSATLFALGFSSTLLTVLFSTEPQFIDVFANNIVITAPIWNASYNATALLSREYAPDAASGFVNLLSSTQKLNLTAFSTERDPEPTNVTALKIYTSVTTDNGTTTMQSDYLSMLDAYSSCVGLVVEYQNTSNGAFRGNPDACGKGQYGFGIDARLRFGRGSAEIYLTADSWGQLTWQINSVPTAKIQQREILTQINGSTLRVSETYSTFDSVATTTYDPAGVQKLCESIMGVHRDSFDAGLCSNMTIDDVFSFHAMDLQYNEEDNAMMVRYCSVNCESSTYPGIKDGSGDDNVFYPTPAGSDMLSIKGTGAMYYVNITKEQNTVLQVNIASSASVQKSVPNQAVGELSSQVTDFSMIHTDTSGVPGAQTLYTALLAKTLSVWQKPQIRAPVGQYSTTDSRPWIRTRTLVIAVVISLVGLVLALCIERWFLLPYYTTTFMANVRAATSAEGTPKNVFAEIRESGKEGEPAYVTLNSLRLVLERSEEGAEKDYLISGGWQWGPVEMEAPRTRPLLS